MNNPNDIELWKLKHGNVGLAQVLTCLPHIRSKKVIHHSLNGAPYLQQVGVGSTILDLTIFVESQDEILKIDKLNADGEVITVYYRGVTYHGFIEDEFPEWNPPINDGQHYTGKMTISVIQSIPDRE